MLKIELRDNPFAPEKRYIVVNDIEDKESYYSDFLFPSAGIYNEEVISILISHSFREVGKQLTKISFSYDLDWWDYRISISIICKEVSYEKSPYIRINLQLQDWEHWTKPWSMSSLAKQFEINTQQLKHEKIKYWQNEEDSILNGFGIDYFPSNEETEIANEINAILMVTKKIVLQTNRDLLSSIDQDSVITFFQFPSEIRTACKQYLIYFSQFLADLGIPSNTEIKEELNYTLFKVTPQDKNESLEQIRQALTIYLNVPNDISAHITYQSDISIKQWEANIYHLKSQLALSTSIIQAKDTTIEMLQLSNYQYKQLLKINKNDKDENKEDIIKGILSVDKYEEKGFILNIAEILRRLKRAIKK
ncbi:hypothetical protein ABXT08_04420 [Chryseobacterium sp. NRRL B-14859]|uniref:hypothetical protein n=1 Tax=Chryseobacterium sp. NRRL B-14859 TaxID=1562763 RepID=UPI0033926167